MEEGSTAAATAEEGWAEAATAVAGSAEGSAAAATAEEGWAEAATAVAGSAEGSEEAATAEEGWAEAATAVAGSAEGSAVAVTAEEGWEEEATAVAGSEAVATAEEGWEAGLVEATAAAAMTVEGLEVAASCEGASPLRAERRCAMQANAPLFHMDADPVVPTIDDPHVTECIQRNAPRTAEARKRRAVAICKRGGGRPRQGADEPGRTDESNCAS